MYGLSCPSTRLCEAVDTNGLALSTTNPTGGRQAWRLNRVQGSELDYLSCASRHLCVASAGHRILSSTDPWAAHPHWTRASKTFAIEGLACPSQSLCIAAGSSGDLIASSHPADGKAWQTVPIEPIGPKLAAVACPSVQFCVAGDSTGRLITTTNPAGTAQWALAGTTPSGVAVTAISCAATTLCVAVDSQGVALSSNNPASPGAWSATAIDPGHAVTSVSCPSAGLCLAVDDRGMLFTSTDPSGGVWSSAGIGDGTGLTAVSCASPQLCFAGDQHGRILGSTNPTGGPGAWQPMAPNWAGSNPVHATAIASISCPSQQQCEVIDRVGDLFSVGGTWAGSLIDPSQGEPMHGPPPPNQPTSISCPSMQLCAAVDAENNVLVSTGPTQGWTRRRVGTGPLAGVSCPSNELCLAVDTAGFAAIGQ